MPKARLSSAEFYAMSKLDQLKAVLSDSDTWPNWPFMPVVNRKGKGLPLPGLIIAGNPMDVYVGVNMFALPEKLPLPVEFSCYENMALAGWEID